jgi:hypothetical protein
MAERTAASTTSLESVAAALERGALDVSATYLQLERIVGPYDVAPVQRVLTRIQEQGMTSFQAAMTLRLVVDARRATDDYERPQLVWSDLDVRGLRDTAVVAQELFRSAERSVVVSTFSVGYHREPGELPGHPLLRPLAERMSAKPNLSVRVFLNVKRMDWQVASPSDDVVGRFARWFRSELWPWERVPSVYFDPRSLDGGEEAACLHAKCIVVDDERAFVTSANLTEAAHVRNIEAGVLLRDHAFAKELRLQFEALVNRRLVQEIGFVDAP